MSSQPPSDHPDLEQRAAAISFDEKVVRTLVCILCTSRGSDLGVTIVPIRWWSEGQALCLVHENPPSPGLRGFRRSLVTSLGEDFPRADSYVRRWAYEIAHADLWSDFSIVAEKMVKNHRIIWRGDLRKGLPATLEELIGCSRE